jgi:hypothetical protein
MTSLKWELIAVHKTEIFQTCHKVGLTLIRHPEIKGGSLYGRHGRFQVTGSYGLTISSYMESQFG